TALGWNQNARLSAVKSGSNILARYDYDGFGQRVVKTLSATDVTLYQYGQDGMLLEEATYKGVPLADYIYLDGRPIATLTPSGTLYFLQDDLLGTPQMATDSSQNLAWQATYKPFGQASVSGTPTQNLRLPGQYYDIEGGWNHNGFRNYLPDLGRYAEPDPLAMPGTTRFYDSGSGRFINGVPAGFASSRSSPFTYVRNNPINSIDASGLADVYIWPYTGSAGNWGHAALMLNNGTYISWWPGIPRDSNFIFPQIYSAPPLPPDFGQNQNDEGTTPTIIHLDNLDENAIQRWWDKFRKDHQWKTLSQNCSTTVAEALDAG